MPTLGNLPDELLVVIFNGCSVHELGRLAQVRILNEEAQEKPSALIISLHIPLLDLRAERSLRNTSRE